jgi:hypothetical protein
MDHYRIPLLFPVFVLFALLDLYMDDKVLADREVNLFTLNPAHQHNPMNETNFMLYSDRIRAVYPSYELDNKNRVVAGPETPTLNFNEVVSILLSKDLNRNEELKWVEKETGGRFLDKSVSMRNHGMAFLSYPRSGNTMLRVFLETITGITTGAAETLEGGGVSLQTAGLKGEMHVCEDDTVWITKTHPMAGDDVIPGVYFTAKK